MQVTLAQTITFNLKDAELSTVVNTVAEITGKNFIVDPRVKGKVTVISSRPMSKEEAYQVFLSLLEVHGFAAVEVGRVVKIIPDVNAKQSVTPVATDGRPGVGDEVVTRVVEVQNVAAAQLVPILRPLVPQQGHLVAYAPTNVLIVSDRAANITRMVEIIHRIDQPGAENEIEIIPLEHASAAEVVRIINALLQQEKKDPAAQGMLDNQIVVADERTNSVLLGGDKPSKIRLRAIIAHLDTPLESEGNIRVVYLRYAKAKDLVPVLTGLGSSIETDKKTAKGGGAGAAGGAPAPAPAAPTGGTTRSGSGATLNIQADEATNALVITAAPDVFQALNAVIRQLDIRRAQVNVESIIAEITSRRATELGVQWLFDGTPSGDKPVGAVNFTAGTSIVGLGSAIIAQKSGSGNVAVAPPVAGGLTLGVGKFNSNSFNFGALVRALDGDGSVNVLSTPNVVTLDNVAAEITVGQVVPFVTGSYSSVGTGGATPTNPFQTVNREDVGVKLKVTPQINEGDAIKLEIEQEVSSLAPSEVAGGRITNKRSIKTSILVSDGQTVVLGGLITDNQDEAVQKVPLLGDIPLLGSLFRYKNKNKEKTNLMVFIRPTILRDAAVTGRLTSAKYDYIRAKQLEVERTGRLLLEDSAPPVLPELVQPSQPSGMSDPQKNSDAGESELPKGPPAVAPTAAPAQLPPAPRADEPASIQSNSATTEGAAGAENPFEEPPPANSGQ